MSLKVSVSGVRGVVGKSLTPESILNYTLAYANFIKHFGNKVAVARDTRKSGDMIFDIVCGALKSSGIDVYDYGILPTPVLIYAVKKHNHAGGIIITASHNPEEWNALKFVKNPGFFLNQNDLQVLLGIKNTGAFSYSTFDSCGKLYKKNNKQSFVNEYVDDLIQNFDIDLIRKRNFKVAYDPVNATSGYVTPVLLDKLGVSLIGVNEDVDKGFQRGTEPTPENLSGLESLVKERGLDCGFAHDPDGDRLAVVDNKGKAIGEELTLALSIYNGLKHKSLNTDIVVNLSTSALNENTASKFSRKVYEAKVGEINVTEEMILKNCALGGEGNGGVIYPIFNSCRDSFVGIMFILELMASENKALNKIIEDNFPVFYITKTKLEIDGLDTEKIYSDLKKKFKDCTFNSLDGLKIKSNDYWIHIRPSNTEPVLRIILESESLEKNESLLKRVKEIIIE